MEEAAGRRLSMSGPCVSEFVERHPQTQDGPPKFVKSNVELRLAGDRVRATLNLALLEPEHPGFRIACGKLYRVTIEEVE